jgi:coproporphyrinogen III oxidase
MLAKEDIKIEFEGLQDRICKALENADGKAVFQEDIWKRAGGGGGRTRVMSSGKVIEKGGVNFSEVFGEMPQEMQKKMNTQAQTFYATGVSIVIHPHNPHVPIIHMNVRYFEMNDGTWWFGGGIDLTPHYIVREDARFFHQSLQKVCNQHHLSYYPDFKKWADDYFYIPHRQETRGVGGIFFDRLKGDNKASLFAFVQAVGDAFAPIYTQLMQKNKDLPFTEKEKQWQMLRRGRYVEFNLVYDLGTKFGLETSGRIESILMSLPAQAGWQYNFIPEAHSAEAFTLEMLKKGVDWL